MDKDLAFLMMKRIIKTEFDEACRFNISFIIKCKRTKLIKTANSPSTSRNFRINWLILNFPIALSRQKLRRSMSMMSMTKLPLTSRTLATSHGPKYKLSSMSSSQAPWFSM